MVSDKELEKILKHLDKSGKMSEKAAIMTERAAIMTERLTWILAMMTIMLFLFASHDFFRDFGDNQQWAFIKAIATTIVFTGLVIWIVKKDPDIGDKIV